MSQLLTVGDCVKRSNVSRATLYRKMQSGELKSIKIGALRRIPEDAYEQWIADMRTGSR